VHVSSWVSAAFIAGVVVVLQGCSVSGISPSTADAVHREMSSARARESEAQQRSIATLNRTGIGTRFLAYLRLLRPSHMAGRSRGVRPDSGGAPKLLAVSDIGTLGVDLLNKQYVYSGTITDGINGPDGNFIDGRGNLYVANYNGANVTEYPYKGTSPSFTYNAGLSDPVNVTTDPNGNVYVADYNQGNAGQIVEYPQGVNTPSNLCSTGLANDGIAVTNKGDVFVAGNNPSTGAGQLLEYPGGLAGCNELSLAVTMGMAGGLQIDRKGNLVACDQDAGVDIIPPPYGAISKTIGGALEPFRVALNKNNSLIYIVDAGNFDVLVDRYPTGTPLTTLGSANGLYEPFGVATFPYAKK
jgi:hypothetical protein